MADKSINQLPVSDGLTDNGLLVVYQNSEAQSIKGSLIKKFAQDSVEPFTSAAESSAEEAAKSAAEAKVVRNEFSPVIAPSVMGVVVSLLDSANRPFIGLNLYGKTVQNGTPAPDAPIAFESVGDSGSISLAVGFSEADETPQTLEVATPNGLPGIQHSSGAHTDSNGQRWICDEIDFSRGVYIKRIGTFVTTPSTRWYESKNPNTGEYIGSANIHMIVEISGIDRSIYKVVCDRLAYTGTFGYSNERYLNVCGNVLNNISVAVDVDKTKWPDIDAWTDFVADNPLTFKYILATPVETPLSDEELAAYAALHTNYTETTVSNDAGAEMAVQYAADTKIYIDNKFAELNAAILSMGGNV